MKLTREQRRAEARADVAMMRELGMLKWGTVVLGPPPVEAKPAREMTAEERQKLELDREQRKHDIMFAASSTKPRLHSFEQQQTAERDARIARVTANHVPREVIAPGARDGGQTPDQS